MFKTDLGANFSTSRFLLRLLPRRPWPTTPPLPAMGFIPDDNTPAHAGEKSSDPSSPPHHHHTSGSSPSVLLAICSICQQQPHLPVVICAEHLQVLHLLPPQPASRDPPKYTAVPPVDNARPATPNHDAQTVVDGTGPLPHEAPGGEGELGNILTSLTFLRNLCFSWSNSGGSNADRRRGRTSCHPRRD